MYNSVNKLRTMELYTLLTSWYVNYISIRHIKTREKLIEWHEGRRRKHGQRTMLIVGHNSNDFVGRKRHKIWPKQYFKSKSQKVFSNLKIPSGQPIPKWKAIVENYKETYHNETSGTKDKNFWKKLEGGAITQIILKPWHLTFNCFCLRF